MPVEASPVERPPSQPRAISNGNGVPSASGKAKRRLRREASANHEPDSYEDMKNRVDFSPMLLSSLERYLPSSILGLPREDKANYMRDILLRYSPEGERTRVRTNSFSFFFFFVFFSLQNWYENLYGYDSLSMSKKTRLNSVTCSIEFMIDLPFRWLSNRQVKLHLRQICVITGSEPVFWESSSVILFIYFRCGAYY